MKVKKTSLVIKKIFPRNIFRFYFDFLSIEIPNIIQILTLPSILGILLQPNTLPTVIIPGISSILMTAYLGIKMRILLWETLSNPRSFMKRYGINFSKFFTILIIGFFIASLFLTFLLNYVTNNFINLNSQNKTK
jgi:hypothetical protein